MNIRSFKLSDLSLVKELLQVALSEECYEHTMGPFARQLSWDSELIIVAEQGDAIIGLLIGTIDRNFGCYYRIAVHPDMRGRGIGTALITFMEKRFMQRNVSGIMVAGDEHNEAVMPLYAALGYDESKVLRTYEKLSIVAQNA